MQRGSIEMADKIREMRELVGDDIHARVLEQFLLATKGNVEAAIEMCWANNGKFPEDGNPTMQDTKTNTSTTSKQRREEIDHIHEIVGEHLSLDEVAVVYDRSNSDLNAALEKCLENVEQSSSQDRTSSSLSTTTTRTPTSSALDLIEINDSAEYVQNSFEEDSSQKATTTSTTPDYPSLPSDQATIELEITDSEGDSKTPLDRKPRRTTTQTSSKRTFVDLEDIDSDDSDYAPQPPTNDGVKKRRLELKVEDENDEDAVALLNKDVMEIYEAIKHKLAPSLIAETYKNCGRQKQLTLSQCVDFIEKRAKKAVGPGSSSAPLDVEDQVTRKLNFNEGKVYIPGRWPKYLLYFIILSTLISRMLLGSFISTVILMGCRPLPEDTRIFIKKRTYGSLDTIYAFASADSPDTIGSLVDEHTKLLGPLLGERVKVSAVSLGSSFNPNTIGGKLEMPIFVEVYLTEYNVIGDFSYKKALGVGKKKLQKDKSRPLGNLLHTLFSKNSTASNFKASSKLRRTGGDNEEDNFDMEQLGQLISDSDKDLPEAEPHESLTVQLRDYQKQGLWWLLNREQEETSSKNPMWERHTFENKEVFYYNSSTDKVSLETPARTVLPRGGLLCDDMGLGKTIQSISLILSNPKPVGYKGKDISEGDEVGKPVAKSTLILCPVSLVTQWKSEIEKFVKRGHLKTFVYYGKEREISAKQLETYDVVITSHSIVASEFFSALSVEERKKKAADVTPNSLVKMKSNSTLHKIKWWRVIVDEAHVMRTKSTNVAKAAHHLQAEHRWCLTGTPIQNKLEDMYSLMKFLRVEPLQSYSWWQEHIEKPCMKGDQTAVDLLRNFLAPLLLRRTKTGKITSALNLPTRSVDVLRIDFNEKEKQLYQSLFAKTKERFKEMMRKGTVMSNYTNVLSMLLRLRQVCDHSKLIGDVEDQLKAIPTHDARCGLCFDILENAMIAPCCGQCFCRECIIVGLLSMRDSETSPSKCPACENPLNENQLEPIGTGVTAKDAIDLEKGAKVSSNLLSSKIEALLAELKKVNHQKTVIFSQWTKMIDIVEEALDQNGLANAYVRLDGAMSLQQRDKSLKDFQQIKKLKVMLISLKAGGVGLNLTQANNVFLLDPWWNPAAEDQAIDRVHRIGQTQAVVVKRLIMKHSIEEQILEMQQKKTELVQTAIGNKNLTGEPIGNFKLRLEDLQQIFGES